MVGSGLLITVTLTQDTLIETVHGDEVNDNGSFKRRVACRIDMVFLETVYESCVLYIDIWLYYDTV